jgi:sugar (pentulose or hexulose) kinase
MSRFNDFTLVLDIGKTHAKLLAFDGTGALVSSNVRRNEAVDSELGYAALDVHGIESWLWQQIASFPHRQHVRRVVPTTHGAAFCGLDATGLALPPIDYEWDGYDEVREAYRAACDPFEVTGTPHLPLGLNAGLQLYWLQRRHTARAERVRAWLPYAQYWAWRLSGVAASEVSALGCHTHLWKFMGGFSDLAMREGLAARFAPMRRAWDRLGPVDTALGNELGLPADCEVVCGAHDSNACLAGHLSSGIRPATLVSTGTWTVVMAPSAKTETLDAARDMLVNVSIDAQPVPTARFMGGREFAALCAGAPPQAATAADLARLIESSTVARPAFTNAGGPFRDVAGSVSRHGMPLPTWRTALSEPQRATLATLYCAQLTAWTIERLGALNDVVIEGPFAGNDLYLRVLATLLPDRRIATVDDSCEATARGAWMIANWQVARDWRAPERTALPVSLGLVEAVRAMHRRWLDALPTRYGPGEPHPGPD